jgi:hypothetical protein
MSVEVFERIQVDPCAHVWTVCLIFCRETVANLSSMPSLALIVMKLAKEASLQEIQRLYLRFKEEVFRGKRPYNPAPLERLLKQEFGEDTMLTEFTKHK